MKWIGQHIWDYYSRFRNDVYLDSLTTTTDTSVLVVDSNNKICKSTTLADDVIEEEIDTLPNLSSFGVAAATTNILAGDIDWYNPVTDGNPSFRMGVDVNECFQIISKYQSGTQSMQQVYFTTYTASGTADDGEFVFIPDEVPVLDIDDGGIDFRANKGISIAGTDILTDSSGTATLSNIDALDATTEATIEAAIDTLAGPIEIEQGASGGGSALLIDNNDIDQIALEIDATVNTTANALRIDANALTTGSAISLDIDDALTTTAAKKLIDVDYDKAGDTASGQTSTTVGLYVDFRDTATDNVGTIDMIGASVGITSADADGTAKQTGYSAILGGGDVATMVGYQSQCTDGSIDFKAMSKAVDGDYFTIATTTNGATTLTTVDASHALANFEIAADGDITLDSAGQIKLEPVAGNNILLDGTLTVDGGTVIPVATAHDAAGTSISIGAGSTTAGTTNNIAGGALTIHGGQGKGSGAGGDIVFRTANAGSSGSTLNSFVTALTISDDLGATFAGTITGNLTGNVLGDIEGNVTGDVEGNVTGNVSGTAATVTGATQTAITTLAGLTSFGANGATTNILAGDLTMYNAVNDGNPTISLGSSATNRLEIKSTYNSGAQTLCDVNFSTYTSSGTTNDGRFVFEVDDVEVLRLLDSTLVAAGDINCSNGGFTATNTTTSSATEGGLLKLQCDDGAVMADNHRLGVIEFKGAEDTSNTTSIGARIQAIARDAWDGSNNDADLEFYTTDGTTESKVLTLDADKKATFAGDVTVTGNLAGQVAVLRCSAFYVNDNPMVQNSLYFGHTTGSSPWNWNDPAAVGGVIGDTSSFTIAGDDENWGIVLPFNISKVEVQCSMRPQLGTSGPDDFTLAIYTGVRSDDSSADLTLTKVAHNSVNLSSTVNRYTRNDLDYTGDLNKGTMIYVGVGSETSGTNMKNGRGYMNITVVRR